MSKAYSLISRFSEDIDITIFREDLDLGMSLDELEKLSGKQQRKYFDKIKETSQQYICQQLMPHMQSVFNELFGQTKRADLIPNVTIDPSDSSGQTLLIKYPSLDDSQMYVLPTVKIEGGAKSALDPHQHITIKPYVADDLPNLELVVNNVVTIEPDRTFWDKIIILHGIRRWFDNKGMLRQNGHRYSRHYYDAYMLLKTDIGRRALDRKDLAIDCARHAQVFFNSSDLDLKNAREGTFSIAPNEAMIKELKKDYFAMSSMIFGDIPNFDDVINLISTFENTLNQRN